MIENRIATRIARVTGAVVMALALAACGASKPAKPTATKTPNEGALRALRYTTITTDNQNVSQFKGGMVRFDEQDYAPPAAPLGVSEAAGTDSIVFLSFPVGWVGEWHPAPRRQFVFILAGRVEVEVGTGEKHEFGPGDVILALDTQGRGHISRTVGNERALSAAIALGD